MRGNGSTTGRAKTKNSAARRQSRRREPFGEGRALSADDVTESIAERLRAYRIGLGLTVRGLATRSGVSPSMVSEAENGAKMPSIAVLIALAEALGISLTQLVGKESSRGPIHVLARADHRVLTDRNGVRREHLGTNVTGSVVEFVRFVLPAGAETGLLSSHQPGSIEHAHVAQGRVEIRVSGERIRAVAGHSIVFPADQAHGYENIGNTEATIYVVVEPLWVHTRRQHPTLGSSHVNA
jgi:transcriptional regulator with XRE-family HTH domain